jgi:DNA-binding MarR family transcriptional regulator
MIDVFSTQKNSPPLIEFEEDSPRFNSNKISLAVCGELSAAWESVLSLLNDLLRISVVRLINSAELLSLTARGHPIDILVFTSDQIPALEEVLRTENSELAKAWLITQADDVRSCYLAPHLPRLLATFSRATTEDDLLSTFMTIARQRWIFARSRPIPKLAPMQSAERTDMEASGAESFIRTLKNISSLAAVRRSIFGAAGKDPYLSIILQVAHASHMVEQVDLTSLSGDLKIPLSTLARKIDYLCDFKFLSRSQPGDDRRKVIIQLTDLGLEKVRTYINYVVSHL